MPPSDMPYPRKCLAVASTPSCTWPWIPAHVRGADAAGEVRILAVRLLDAAPARITGDVEHRCERLAGTDRDELLPDHVSDLAHELLVPRRREPDRLREHGRPRAQ